MPAEDQALEDRRADPRRAVRVEVLRQSAVALAAPDQRRQDRDRLVDAAADSS
jgi:hypothetical protein